MPTKKFKVKTELHGSLRDHPKSGLRTTKEEAHFLEEGSGVCGVDQLHRDAEGDETRGGGCASGEKGLEDIPGGGGQEIATRPEAQGSLGSVFFLFLLHQERAPA